MTADLTPLGELLEEARERVVRITGREAARRAGISETRWRQVVKGRASAGRGQTVSVSTTPKTVIAMARAVEVDPVKALEAAGLEYDPRDLEVAPAEPDRPRDIHREMIAAAPVDEETRALMYQYLEEERARERERLTGGIQRMIDIAADRSRRAG